MEVLVALLALIGFLALIVVCGVAVALWFGDALDEADPDPYREGLDASARISAMAFEAERMMHQIAHEDSSEES